MVGLDIGIQPHPPHPTTCTPRIANFYLDEYESALDALTLAAQQGDARLADVWAAKCKAELAGMHTDYMHTVIWTVVVCSPPVSLIGTHTYTHMHTHTHSHIHTHAHTHR